MPGPTPSNVQFSTPSTFRNSTPTPPKPIAMSTFVANPVSRRLAQSACSSVLRTSSSNSYHRPQPSRILSPAFCSPRLPTGYICRRCMHKGVLRKSTPSKRPEKSFDRGPPSQESTQTNFGAMNVLGSTPPPAFGVEACLDDGFELNDNLIVPQSGVMLLGGQAFRWRPWAASGRRNGSQEHGARLLNARGQFEPDLGSWGVLDVIWPKPGECKQPTSEPRTVSDDAS